MSDVWVAVRMDTSVAWRMKTSAVVPGEGVSGRLVKEVLGGRVEGALEDGAGEETEYLAAVVNRMLRVSWAPERYFHWEVG